MYKHGILTRILKFQAIDSNDLSYPEMEIWTNSQRDSSNGLGSYTYSHRMVFDDIDYAWGSGYEDFVEDNIFSRRMVIDYDFQARTWRQVAGSNNDVVRHGSWSRVNRTHPALEIVSHGNYPRIPTEEHRLRTHLTNSSSQQTSVFYIPRYQSYLDHNFMNPFVQVFQNPTATEPRGVNITSQEYRTLMQRPWTKSNTITKIPDLAKSSRLLMPASPVLLRTQSPTYKSRDLSVCAQRKDRVIDGEMVQGLGDDVLVITGLLAAVQMSKTAVRRGAEEDRR